MQEITKSKDLEGRIAIITGGSKGIGREIALALYNNGASISICARTKSDVDKLVEEVNDPGRCIGFVVDVTNQEGVKQMIEEIENKFGSVDILVNNAGVGSGGPYWLMDPEEIWHLLEVNLKGPMMFSYYCIPIMMKKQHGLIINIGSYAGIRPGGFAVPYSVSKSGLARFSDSLASSVAEYGINVFTLSPGLVLTDMTKDVPVFKDIPKDRWSPIDGAAKLVLRLTKKDVTPLNGRFIHVIDDIDVMLKESTKINDLDLYSLRMRNLDGLIP